MPWVGWLAASRFGRWKKRFDEREFLIGQVACVALADHRIFHSIGFVPGHANHSVLLQSQRIAVRETGQPVTYNAT